MVHNEKYTKIIIMNINHDILWNVIIITQVKWLEFEEKKNIYLFILYSL